MNSKLLSYYFPSITFVFPYTSGHKINRLTLPFTNDLIVKTGQIKTSWMKLAVALDISIEDIRIINAKYPIQQDSAMAEMIMMWTENYADISWSRVVHALRAIGEQQLAETLEEDKQNC